MKALQDLKSIALQYNELKRQAGNTNLQSKKILLRRAVEAVTSCTAA